VKTFVTSLWHSGQKTSSISLQPGVVSFSSTLSLVPQLGQVQKTISVALLSWFWWYCTAYFQICKSANQPKTYLLSKSKICRQDRFWTPGCRYHRRCLRLSQQNPQPAISQQKSSVNHIKGHRIKCRCPFGG